MSTIYIIERRERHFWAKHPEYFFGFDDVIPENFLFHDNLELRQ